MSSDTPENSGTGLMPPAVRTRLEANRAIEDAVPVARFFNPVGEAVWLAVSIAEDGDALYGMADLGFGCPEAGSFSLAELSALHLPLGLGIERDLAFKTELPLSIWLDIASDCGSLAEAARIIGYFERITREP